MHFKTLSKDRVVLYALLKNSWKFRSQSSDFQSSYDFSWWLLPWFILSSLTQKEISVFSCKKNCLNLTYNYKWLRSYTRPNSKEALNLLDLAELLTYISDNDYCNKQRRNGSKGFTSETFNKQIFIEVYRKQSN